jgi:serine/threonine protein kinase
MPTADACEEMPVADADTRIGGRYRLDRQIAAGGMGTVWQAWDEVLHRTVAVKKLHLQAGLSPEDRDVAVQRAMREARLTARLHHPNAVQVFDIVDEQGSPCLIMQYVPSRSLQDIVRENGPLPADEVARIGTQVAAALAAAHRAGIVHRDVKPGNILIAEDGTAKITDFGISHAFDDVTLTSTGMVTGTPAYLAPEVARGATSDFASDVYSLGSTLYMAVEGRPPFGAEQGNPMAVLHRVASGESEPPTRSGPLTPVLQTMMSTDASGRPSMNDIANTLPDLHRLAAEDPAASSTTQVITRERDQVRAEPAPVAHPDTRAFAAPPRPSSPGPPPPVRRPPPAPPIPPPDSRDDRHRRSWLPIAAVAVVVAIAVVLGIVLLSSSGDSNNNAGGATSGQSSPSAPPTSSSKRASSSSASSSTQSSSASSTSASSSASTGTPTGPELAAAVSNYFSYIPGNLDAGWAHLTPHFQKTKAKSRQSYDSYWKSISRVDVTNASGRAPDTASATLTYHYANGHVVTQHTTFRFVRQGGVLKIDHES